MVIGYARVSSKSQDEATQLKLLREYGCDAIFQEKKSARNNKYRPEFEKAIHALKKGDILVGTKTDRLFRTAHEALEMSKIVEAKGCHICTIDGMCNTKTPIGYLIFGIMALVAQFEGGLIIERTTEGIHNSPIKLQGLWGPKPNTGKRTAPKINDPEDHLKILKMRSKGVTLTKIAKTYNVSIPTILRTLGRIERIKNYQTKKIDTFDSTMKKHEVTK